MPWSLLLMRKALKLHEYFIIIGIELACKNLSKISSLDKWLISEAQNNIFALESVPYEVRIWNTGKIHCHRHWTGVQNLSKISSLDKVTSKEIVKEKFVLLDYGADEVWQLIIHENCVAIDNKLVWKHWAKLFRI